MLRKSQDLLILFCSYLYCHMNLFYVSSNQTANCEVGKLMHDNSLSCPKWTLIL